MASITNRKGKYYVVYWFDSFDGKRKQKWEQCENYEEAIFKKKKIEDEVNNQVFLAPSNQTIREFLETFVELYGTKHWGFNNYKANTGLLNNYVYPLIGDKKIQSFSTLNVDQYINKLTKTKNVNYGVRKNAPQYVSPNTIKSVVKLLRCAWRQALRWEVVKKNVFIDCNLPYCESKEREIWTATEIQHALEICEDQILYLCINLSFSCSLRIGELLALTWDNVFIEDEDFEKDNTRLIIDKQFVRIDKEMIGVLTKDEIYKQFDTQLKRECKTVLVLKSLKMNGKARTVWIPRTVAYMLKEWKKKQNDIKKKLGSIYDDNNLVICFEDGKPIEKTNIEKRFKKFIKVNNLREVVFHSLRHSSATYKLKLSKGDIKATQGDTGHKSADMITKRYAHIIDEDRKVNATKFEDEFYASNETEEKDDASELLDILKNNDSLREQLKKMLSL